LILAASGPAWGHLTPSSTVALRLHPDGIDAELTLPVGELATAWERSLPSDSVKMVRRHGEELKDYVRAHVRPVAPDGRPWAVTVRDVIPLGGEEPDVRVTLTLVPPSGAPADRLTFGYDVIFHHLLTHTAVITLAGDRRNGETGETPVVLGTMRDTNAAIVIDRAGGSWLRRFAAMFRLGARHIAEGTDHLLFLLALILPAPLVAEGWRWGRFAGGATSLRRIVKIVTAFTVGHSITLVVGALGWASLPDALVESAIALSILVSAVHALTPIFRGREVYIAAGFGLVHGLAFASTLTDFGLDPWTLASSVLGFNLGIEAFQILVVLASMPWLVLLARTRVYGPIRVVGAMLTGVAAAAWFAERALGWDNPVGPVVEEVASRAFWGLVGLVALAVAAMLLAPASPRPSPSEEVLGC